MRLCRSYCFIAFLMLSVWISPLLNFSARAQNTPRSSSQVPGDKSAQQKPPDDTVRIATELVQIDLIVNDKQGKSVTDLKQEDFEIFEDGKPQQISFFSVGTSARPAEWLRPREKSGPAARENETVKSSMSVGRYIVLAIDDIHLSASSLMTARQSLLKFIDQQMTGSDQVALVTTSGNLGMYEQFTSDREALKRALNRLSVQERQAVSNMDIPRISAYQAQLIENNDRDALNVAVQELVARFNTPPDMAAREVQSKARMIVAQTRSFTIASLSTLENIIRGLRDLNARKLIVLVSDGFLVNGGGGDYFDVRRLTDAATRAGSVIYSIDARGLYTYIPGGDAATPSLPFDATNRRESIERASMEAQRDAIVTLANETGGTAFYNSNDLNLGLQKIMDDNESYYVLAFEPTSTYKDGRFRKLEVKVKNRPELKVRTRKGYYEPDAKAERKAIEKAEKVSEKLKNASPEEQEKAVKKEKTEKVREALSALYPLRGIPLEISADFLAADETQAVAVLNARIDTQNLTYELRGDKRHAVLEMVILLFDEKGNPAGDFVENLQMNLRDETYNRLLTSGVQYNRSVPLKPGYYQVRIAIRQEGNKLLGSAAQWIDIPDLASKKLAMSGVFLTMNAAALQQAVSNSQRSQTGLQNEENSQSISAQVSRRFKRESNFDYTVFAYNVKTNDQGVSDLVLQTQIFSGSKLIYASPVGKITPPPELSAAAARTKLMMYVPYAARLSLKDFKPGNYDLRVVVIDRLTRTTAKRSINFVVE